MFDVRIVNGSLVDGSGSEASRLDVGITGGRIAAIDDLSAAESKSTIDAEGQIVCPGFIDAHSHSDAYLLLEPSSPSKVFQGITTEVIGNCGASAAPLRGEYKMPSDWRDKEYPGTWSSLAEYRELLEAQKPGPNVVMLVGHNTLRAGVVGYENREAAPDELQEMKRQLAQSLDEGGRGLSTGLIYPPGVFAPFEEIVELCRVVRERDGIYTSHMRSEGRDLLNAIAEAVSIGRDSGVRVEISHLKTSGSMNWGLVDDAMGLIRAARERGQCVRADRYPYTSANTELDVIFPAWAIEGGPAAELERLKDGELRKKLRDELLESRSPEYWKTVTVGSTFHPDHKRFQGMCLVDIAGELGLEPVDAVLRLVELDELKTGAFFFGMNEENMRKILQEPYVMIGSDASLRSPYGVLSGDHPHPRAYGTFPRFIRMALDEELMGLEEAIRKATSLPAEQFGLKDRGLIACGRKADIAVISIDDLKDLSDYGAPHQLSTGVRPLLVHGVHTIADGSLTGHRGGTFL